MKKSIVVAIETDGKYCSSDCQFMSRGCCCSLFGEDLYSDSDKKTGNFLGWFRLFRCCNSEITISKK